MTALEVRPEVAQVDVGDLRLPHRFWAKVRVDEGGCWVWTAYCWKGYGRFSCIGAGARGRRMVLAHRFSYETLVGPIPEAMTVDHRCFQPKCVNPAHLRLLTRRENARNQRSATKTHCCNGHEFTSENTRYKTPRHRQGVRDCRLCNADAVARYKARKRVAA